jgi:hypothetical protein
VRRDLEPVAVPYLGRMIVVPAILAHGFALAGLVSGWSEYRWPWAAVGLLVLSMALPLVLVVAPRRASGRLPARAAALVVAGVFAVSTALPALLPPAERASFACWNWGTGAMTFLGVAAYLSTRRTIALALAHAALAVGVQLLSGGGSWRLHLVVVSTLVPPLGAAQYLRFYADALRQRARAVAAQLEAEEGRHELDARRSSGDRRLGALRDDVEPLLRYVAEGGPLPLDDARARAAQQLAENLRAALVAHRRALWLPEYLGDAAVTVVCSDAAARGVGTAERAWLAALLELLDTFPCWRAVHVVLDPRDDGSVSAVVTAEGPAAAQAAADPRVGALAARRQAQVEADGNFFSVDADLRAMIGA